MAPTVSCRVQCSDLRSSACSGEAEMHEEGRGVRHWRERSGRPRKVGARRGGGCYVDKAGDENGLALWLPRGSGRAGLT